MANTVKVQGSKTVARARKGDTGNGGITYRITVWENGKEYRNDSSLKTDGERIIDIAVNKAMSLIGDTTFKAYKCRVTHTSDTQSRPLTAGTYWEAINTFQPIVTPVLLADTIAANFIDVDELKVKHLDGADGSFSGVLSFPFVGLINNATFDYSTGGGQNMYYTMHNDVMSVEIYYSDRFYGTPYSSTPRYNHFELPSNVPDGTVLNIMAAAINYKDTARPVYFSGNIYYGTNPSGSYMGSSLLKATEIMVKDTFFLRMMSYEGNWYMLSNMGEFEVTAT